MPKIRCLIVDDEPPAVELLEKYVSMIDQLELVGKSHSAVKAFDFVKAQQVDLLFLDIQMPVLNGIDFIKTLKSPPAVILTTAYREYALDGYDLDIIDYLLKPIAFDRFLKAVDRYQHRAVKRQPQISSEKVIPNYLFFNVNRTHHKILLEDILYVESLKDYVRIHTKNKPLVVKGNLGSMMKKLPQQRFVRIHRSFAVALAYVSADNQTVVTIGTVRLPIGETYRPNFFNQL
ncbi:MAG: LytTR family DNA-binding domain-containing protein [Bacteroidota bacterium]